MRRVHRIGSDMLSRLQNSNKSHIEALGTGNRNRQWGATLQRQQSYCEVSMRNCLNLNLGVSPTRNLSHHSMACLLPGGDLGRGNAGLKAEEDLKVD